MKTWEKIQLRDVSTYRTDKIDAKLLNESNYISTDNMIQDRQGITASSYVPESGKSSKFEQEDILVSNIRPYFKKIWFADKTGGCSNDVIVFKPKKNVVSPKFLFYQLSKDEFFDFMMAGSNGTKMPRGNKRAIPTYKFLLPQLPTQRRIASILSAYDDLIENNLKRIKLLEELAQRTYEEWFVQMKFPGHENTPVNEETGLPEGWERKTLREEILFEIGGGWGNDAYSDEFNTLGYVIRGTDMNNLVFGNIENVPYRFHKASNMSSRKIQHGDIIFEVSGGSSNEGVGKTVIMVDKIIEQFNDDIMCASFCKLIRPQSITMSAYLFLFLRFLRRAKTTEIWEIRSASNIVNYNWTSFLKFQEITVPDNLILLEFNSLVERIINQIYSLSNQNRLLKESRDILLPRLMGGTISTEKADVQLDAAVESEDVYGK
jgi:type I restriction enzyme, S subunit